MGNPWTLPSGLVIDDPAERLRRFASEEYDYYDGVAATHPNHIATLDVIVATAVNAFSTASAKRIRDVHRGLVAHAEPLLAAVPTDVSLLTADQAVLSAVERLLGAAILAQGVLIAVATKVLHRKRPQLIPMLDSVLVGYYRKALEQRWLAAAWEGGPRAAKAAMAVMQAFRVDLQAVQGEFVPILAALAADGYALTPVRSLEVLIWMQVEPYGYYRAAPISSAETVPGPPTESVAITPASAAEAQLRGWAGAFAGECGLPTHELSIVPPLHDDEANGLALALSSGLVSVEPTGRFRIAGGAAGKGPYNLFSRGPAPALNREYLVQVVAVAKLVLHHGWPARSLIFEHDALDAVAFDNDGTAVVAVEAKRSEALLEAMLAEMQTATPERVRSAATNATRKLASLLRIRASVLWAVAPGVRRAFDLHYGDTLVHMVARDDVPAGPRSEYGCLVCGSEEDVHGEPERDGHIALSCGACGYRWSRVPRRPCPRCGSADVEIGGYRGWAYEDLEQARESNRQQGEWYDVDWDVLRCRRCHHSWQTGHRAGR